MITYPWLCEAGPARLACAIDVKGPPTIVGGWPTAYAMRSGFRGLGFQASGSDFLFKVKDSGFRA